MSRVTDRKDVRRRMLLPFRQEVFDFFRFDGKVEILQYSVLGLLTSEVHGISKFMNFEIPEIRNFEVLELRKS